MLDREGPVPVYRQIAELIRGRIASGSLGPGDPMPSESEIEREFGVARTTARRVARELREVGLVHTIPGKGTFVGPHGIPTNTKRETKPDRIASEIAERVLRGQLPVNRAIPSEKSMMQQHGVARVTVRRAVALLREQGWIFTVPHRGSYVAPEGSWPG
ncbi:GntR family transcriptional regulator [Nonomuraea sp. NPDC050556]|uniref:GntR family transcriptional regulator n=1 Tax=Nonomuraea sp. NPDC050556 TaxID=3364369 RepID=UPI0037B369AC